MNNIYWGHIAGPAHLLVPGDNAGEGRCEAGEWGVQAADVVVYSSLPGLRSWAQSILDTLPPARQTPLIVVDHAQQLQWLTWSGVLDRITADDTSRDTLTLALNLIHAVVADPAAAGWTLGDNVASLWADHADTNGIVAGVRLAAPDHEVGIGAPLLATDFSVRFLSSLPEQADAYLRLIATRINKAH